MENKCNEKISENRQDSERYLMCLKEEHGSMVGGTGWICPLKLSCFEKKKWSLQLVMITMLILKFENDY